MKTSSETDTDLLRAEIAALRTRLSRYEPERRDGDLKDHANISEATINQFESICGDSREHYGRVLRSGR
jgi:hypothetical protein